MHGQYAMVVLAWPTRQPVFEVIVLSCSSGQVNVLIRSSVRVIVLYCNSVQVIVLNLLT